MRYIFQRLDFCSLCDGSGVITNPHWAGCYEKLEAQHGLSADQEWEFIESYFRELGFDYPPDEEVACPDCDGTGEVSDTVNDAVFIASRGLVTREEVDHMIAEALENVMSAVELGITRAEARAMIAAAIDARKDQ